MTYKGYGIYRQGLLCEYRETAEEARKVAKLYHTVYQDLDTSIHEIEILQGKEIKL